MAASADISRRAGPAAGRRSSGKRKSRRAGARAPGLIPRGAAVGNSFPPAATQSRATAELSPKGFSDADEANRRLRGDAAIIARRVGRLFGCRVEVWEFKLRRLGATAVRGFF